MFNSKKLFLVFSLLVILVSLNVVVADGMFHRYYPDYWKLSVEETQLAFINYADGYENMVLSVGFDPTDTDQAVWIFPVPAKPTDTVINVVDSLPNFAGQSVQSKASSTISGTLAVMSMSQFYLVPFYFMFNVVGGVMASGDLLGDGMLNKSRDGVTVYETIEKYGVTTQLVSAVDGVSLYNYLATKGAVLPDESKNVLNNYAGKEYSFVVAWISDSDAMAATVVDEYYGYYDVYKKSIAVFVKFPTDKIFFPLLPTSVYGSKEVPAIIYVASLVSPELYKEIKSTTKVSYFSQKFFSNKSESENLLFNNNIPLNFNYTKVEIDSPSKYYKEDLWFNDSVPFGVAIANILDKNALIWGLLLFILISCVSSLIAGLFFFGKKDLIIKNILLLGVANLLTIGAFSLFAYKFRSKITSLKNDTPLSKRNAGFWIMLIPFIITFLFIGFFISMSFSSIGYYFLNNLDYFFSSVLFELVLLFILLYILLLVITAPITWGYFYDKQMMKFILLFSATFVILLIISFFVLNMLLWI